MTLQNQVCSLELSKELKALGVPQQSYFYWTSLSFTGRGFEWSLGEKIGAFAGDVGEEVSAFTVAELGEMLPEKYRTHKSGKDWYYGIHQKKFNSPAFSSEADARATALVYVLSNKTNVI